jgi:putative heme-binding domain-containing protein
MRLTLITCACLLFVSSSAAQEKEIFEQAPVVAESVVQPDGKATQQPAIKPKKDPLDTKGGPVVQWIWADQAGFPDCFLRKEFEVVGGQGGAIIATCDNVMTLTINGKRLARSASWESPVKVDITKHLKVGQNVLVAQVENEGSVGGFAAKIVLTQGKKKSFIVTDKSWQAAATNSFKEVLGVKVVGKMGDGPWNNVFSNSRAAAPVGRVARGVFEVPAGFQVEELYTVPKNTQGSWVSITTDIKGRLIASDQGGKGLFRITPAKIGSDQKTKIEKLDVALTSAQGMLYAFDSLYVSCNGGPGSGLYRATDTNGDDQFDKVEKLKAIRGGGEHGPHALRLSPDGKSIYLIAGNHTDPPEFDFSRVPANWSEDLLLPRQWDARGHARGKLAPGGWIAKTDPEGKTWEIVSTGYRNPYDFDFNLEGEMFAYDADMEWDMGSSWYRPTRVNHATSGSEFGWRSGTGKWPNYFADSLPAVVNIGPGSPVGVTFGTGAKFPAKYQRALFVCDWTFGTMFAIHMTPSGASYVGQKTEFVSRTPLPLTDVVIGADGAMYFTVGGRGAQSALFRVTYVGDESTAPAGLPADKFVQLRDLRNNLEEHHTPVGTDKESIAWIWSQLSHSDRHIRYAARVALEHKPAASWKGLFTTEKNTDAIITASIAIARQGSVGDRPDVLKKLAEIDVAIASESQKLDYLRALSLTFIRLGKATIAESKSFAAKLAPLYPASASSPNLNRELCRVLVYLDSPTVIAKTLKLLQEPDPTKAVDLGEVLSRNGGYGGTISRMLANFPELQKVHYALVLRNMRFGWTLEQRKQYLQWIADAGKRSGGASYQGFLNNIRSEALANASESERKAVEGLIPPPPKDADLPKPLGPGKVWTMAELVAKSTGLKGRNFEKGKRAYYASRCISCHRYDGEGGATGPDLTNVAGRFSYKDLLESVIEPSKVISDQYKASIVETKKGKIVTGRIVNDGKDEVTVLADAVDVSKTITIKKSDIEEITPSPTSLMPGKLFNQLNEDEILDLLGYLMSRGNPDDPIFSN